jgi:hypothetical protein
MAVPEGYTEVGLIGLVNKGNYDPLTEYSKYNFVYYQGSTYLYINELPQSGVTPSDDGVTWQYMSRGMIMDNTPTQGSPNAVTSGGIYDSERALKTEIQDEQTAATTKATDTNNVLGQGTVTNATNVQALLDNVTDKDTNPTKDSAKTVRSGGVYSADKATREMIAPVEENATSSAPYAIGEQLIFNGVLCEATSAISIGDTLAMGTNLSTANKITNRDSTPTANSTKLVTSGGVYSADNQIRENIANVEGATSAHPYAVGKQLIFNGLLCKATSAIAVGDTLAVGTNLALADNVVEQIYSLNQGLTNSLANISHENLLDNPWFTVNQRGQSSYTDPGNGAYTVDRWKIYNYNTLTVSSNGVSSIELFQYFEEDRVKPLLGKTVTLSILLQDGRIRYSSGQLPNAFPSVETSYIETNIDGNTWIYITLYSSKLLGVKIRNWSDQVIDVRAVKLELGSISTLAMDTAPNYQQELAKCQRYYEQNSWYSWNVKANLDGVIDIMTSYPFLVKKRVNNITTNILKQNIGNGQLIDLTTSTNIPSNEVTISQPMAYNSRMECIKITHNSIISGHTYFFSIGDDCIAFSADL